MRHYILASKSPRRKILLKQIGMKFRVLPSHVPEEFSPNQTPGDNAKRLALEKALEATSHLRKGIVIGADTIVVLDHHILGKPNSKVDARRMLKMLSGREHSVYTGFALIDAASKKQMSGVEETKVRFRVLSEKEIDAYVDSGSPMDKAGAYGIQDDFGAVFIEKVNGCFYNVVGFPLARFYSTLQRFESELDKQIFKIP
jgi:septum formation protein